MLSLKLVLSAIRDGEKASGSIAIDRKKNDMWVRESSIDLVSGTPSAERTILLENDQRMVLEGSSNVEVIYDKEQNAAVPKEKVLPDAKPDDPDLSPEKSLADLAAEEFEAGQRRAAVAKVQEENARKVKEEAEAKAKADEAAKLKTSTTQPSQSSGVQPRPYIPVSEPTRL